MIKFNFIIIVIIFTLRLLWARAAAVSAPSDWKNFMEEVSVDALGDPTSTFGRNVPLNLARIHAVKTKEKMKQHRKYFALCVTAGSYCENERIQCRFNKNKWLKILAQAINHPIRKKYSNTALLFFLLMEAAFFSPSRHNNN